jgi:hypothetical protein
LPSSNSTPTSGTIPNKAEKPNASKQSHPEANRQAASLEKPESSASLWHQPYTRMFRLWHSMTYDLILLEAKIEIIYHNLPQKTTLLISFTT